MRLNYETVLVGQKCILVPYRKEHVERYHEWMQNPELLEATASEPLSLQEEYDMQESWRDDPNKCTFIVLAKEAMEEQSLELLVYGTPDASGNFIRSSVSAMVGDVNLFLSDADDGEDSDKHDCPSPDHVSKQAEIDIMIAERPHRRFGLGKEATALMMYYGATQLKIRRLFCKIKDDNEASLKLFESMGFMRCGYAECFREVELELSRNTSQGLVEALEAAIGPTYETIQSLQCPQNEL